MKINKEDYLVIPAFVVMPQEEGGLGLKGNEALVFSLIYSFSRDGESWFVGSQSYIAAWVGGTRQGIQKNINSLLEKGLIRREYVTKNGTTYVNYQSCHPANFVGGDEEQSLHHIIDHNITPSDIDTNVSISSPPKGKKSQFTPPSQEEVVAYCAEHEFTIDPYEFYDKYTGNGWMVGKVKMKDWQATLRNWERRKRKGETFR